MIKNRDSKDVLLAVEDLAVAFRSRHSEVTVVRDISFDIAAGETVALVGESGCGKSVTALSIARLLPEPPAFFPHGRIMLGGRNTLELSPAELRRVRGREVAYIFQDPATALNPVLTIGYQLREALQGMRGAAARDESLRLLDLAGLADPQKCLGAYPQELSGGMQQRVVIAMALACRPRLLIADEPTTALDVTIQAQILELLRKLQQEFGMSILLITHNLGLVADMAERVNVMYAGYLVESGPVERVLKHPAHPYTAGLLRAVPSLEAAASGRRMTGIDGSVPAPDRMPSGCPFAPRCEKAVDDCRQAVPQLKDVAKGHPVRCVL